ncbi:MAG: hypothetical protein R3284_04380 [Rubricoccaceae bacterium]|nr:hypothetical protein [Rubricoccaceae bacterium]
MESELVGRHLKFDGGDEKTARAMYPTTEVRWFGEGPVPNDLANWFGALGPTVALLERTDSYLIPTSKNEPGIKLREGNLEIKMRTGNSQQMRFASGIEGKVASFSKWIFPLADDTQQPKGGWIDVAKARRVRTFAIDAGEMTETFERLEVGCDVELGDVRIGEQLWWTVCLEAFGLDAYQRIGYLDSTAMHVFSDPLPNLDPAHASDYVGWLLGVSV